uniref:Mirror-image polydactyly 1 n=1 Tax=Mandrillus leucophaeus TaxID=9568 RepID=A0A2K5YS04_MANLE
MNSEKSMHRKSPELVNEISYENTEWPGQRSRNFQIISSHPDNQSVYSTTENYNIMEHRHNDMHYECMTPCQVTSDSDKEKTIAFLLKELDLLRTSNKKLQQKLAEEDKEQRKLKFKLELQEKETEAKIAENTAGILRYRYLISLIHFTQM